MWKLNDFDNVAVKDDNGKELTYKQIASFSNDFKDIFNGRNLLLCLCKNSIGSIIGYITFINNRQVPILINSELDISLINQLLATYKPNYLWLPKEKTPYFDEYEAILNLFDYNLLRRKYFNDINMHEDLALLLTTSGSTGSPKLVRQSYKNIESNIKSIIDYLSIEKKDKAITTLPMNYTYGLSIINTHLYAGATILLTEKSVVSKDFWTFFKENNATSFSGVPYTYEILDKLRFERMNLPSLKTMTQAGGKLSLTLHKKYANYALEHNKKFIVMYGQTEATARMGYLPADKSLEKIGSIGNAIPGGKFYLHDTDSKIINEPDVIGELIYEGGNVTMGYAQSITDLARNDDFNGILVTGDMAKRDSDGFYYIVGRKKRFLKIYGNRVNLDEIERMIKNDFTFIDCACSGFDDNLYIFITDKNHEVNIKKYLIEKTNFYQSAFNIICLDKIPINDSGKILYSELEKYYS